MHTVMSLRVAKRRGGFVDLLNDCQLVKDSSLCSWSVAQFLIVMILRMVDKVFFK